MDTLVLSVQKSSFEPRILHNHSNGPTKLEVAATPPLGFVLSLLIASETYTSALCK